nr:MAG TPA: Trefoil factor 3 trefoil factor, ITF, trefoil [Bacteriophage sp.]
MLVGSLPSKGEIKMVYALRYCPPPLNNAACAARGCC